MSFKSAQEFVAQMKEDLDFRTRIQSIPDTKGLKEYLSLQGFDFDERELIGAMAACMAELDKMMQGMKLM